MSLIVKDVALCVWERNKMVGIVPDHEKLSCYVAHYDHRDKLGAAVHFRVSGV